ncbi:MAG: glycoside hydrolase family 3 protein [Candidatus Eremiobacteraeota bacterium]|nr:glycoside hydrolase family 3 protein [Candidatus Eremiobacteraeota bacterium]
MSADFTTLARGVIAAGFHDSAGPGSPFGAYIVFARNCATLAELRASTDALRARTFDGEPPLIAIDQEGGRVARLRDGVEPMPSMMALGACGDMEPAMRAGEQVAFDLRRAGCTMNFAPSLDLALDPANTVIGNRSLGADPSAVARLGAAFAKGLERGGILACYKHFPGHGSTATDSHDALPSVDADERTLRARDLAPFAAVAPSAGAIMSAHVVVHAFDSTRPASLSPAVTRILRDELRFSGAYLTDCLEMGAVAGLDQRLQPGVVALAAGADLLLVSHDVELAERLVLAIVEAVASGALSEQRLSEAYDRVVRLRRAGALPLDLHDVAPHPGVGREIARRAITLVRGLAHVDPLTSCAIDFGGIGDGPHLSHEAPALERFGFPVEPQDEAAPLEAVVRSGRRPLVLARRAHLHARQARAIAQILERYPDAVVVSMLEPFDLPLFERARHVLAAYGDDLASLGGLADVIFGGSMPHGRLPVGVALGV